MVREKSAQRINVTFDDIAGAPAVPTTVSYAVHCLATGNVLQAFTSATPGNPTLITVGATINTIQNANNEREGRRLTIKANEGLSDALNDEYVYEVVNLEAIP